MKQGKNSLADENIPPTALSRWLKLNKLSINGLAKRIGASPHTVKNMAHGATSTVNTEILRKISYATGLNYEQLVDPPAEFAPQDQTGDERIDIMLGLLAKNMHSKSMVSTCRKYIAPDFVCSGNMYNLHNRPAVNFDEMCALNMLQPNIINSILIATSWYNPKCAENASTTLHTYWRGYITADYTADETVNETFVVIELEKSINQMKPADIPKIKTWWWDLVDHTPETKIMKNPVESHDKIANQYFWPTPEEITTMPDIKKLGEAEHLSS